MNRRTFVSTVGASLANIAWFPQVSSSERMPWQDLQQLFSNPPCPPLPVVISTSVHVNSLSHILAFSEDELREKLRDRSSPIILSTGLGRPIDDTDWLVDLPFFEDIVLWVRTSSDIASISWDELRDRMNRGSNVFFNTERIKYAPIREFLRHHEVNLSEDSGDIESEGRGTSGYDNLIRMALENSDPIVVGLRRGWPNGFRPLAVNNALPIASNEYKLRKPMYVYYLDPTAATVYWTQQIHNVLTSEVSADREIYRYLGVTVPG